MKEDKLLDDFFVSMRRKLLLGAEEFVVPVDIKDFVRFVNAEDLVLLIDTEEEEELHNSSLTTPQCRRGGQNLP